MNDHQICAEEPLVLATAGSSMSQALARHVESCASCREARQLAAQMRPLATIHSGQRPPDADVIWMMAQLSRSRSIWTRDTTKGVATLVLSALLAAMAWPRLTAYIAVMAPKSASAVPFLTSCVIAAGLAVVATQTIRLLTGE